MKALFFNCVLLFCDVFIVRGVEDYFSDSKFTDECGGLIRKFSTQSCVYVGPSCVESASVEKCVKCLVDRKDLYEDENSERIAMGRYDAQIVFLFIAVHSLSDRGKNKLSEATRRFFNTAKNDINKVLKSCLMNPIRTDVVIKLALAVFTFFHQSISIMGDADFIFNLNSALEMLIEASDTKGDIFERYNGPGIIHKDEISHFMSKTLRIGGNGNIFARAIIRKHYDRPDSDEAMSRDFAEFLSRLKLEYVHKYPDGDITKTSLDLVQKRIEWTFNLKMALKMYTHLFPDSRNQRNSIKKIVSRRNFYSDFIADTFLKASIINFVDDTRKDFINAHTLPGLLDFLLGYQAFYGDTSKFEVRESFLGFLHQYSEHEYSTENHFKALTFVKLIRSLIGKFNPDHHYERYLCKILILAKSRMKTDHEVIRSFGRFPGLKMAFDDLQRILKAYEGQDESLEVSKKKYEHRKDVEIGGIVAIRLENLWEVLPLRANSLFETDSFRWQWKLFEWHLREVSCAVHAMKDLTSLKGTQLAQLLSFYGCLDDHKMWLEEDYIDWAGLTNFGNEITARIPKHTRSKICTDVEEIKKITHASEESLLEEILSAACDFKPDDERTAYELMESRGRQPFFLYYHGNEVKKGFEKSIESLHMDLCDFKDDKQQLVKERIDGIKRRLHGIVVAAIIFGKSSVLERDDINRIHALYKRCALTIYRILPDMEKSIQQFYLAYPEILYDFSYNEMTNKERYEWYIYPEPMDIIYNISESLKETENPHSGDKEREVMSKAAFFQLNIFHERSYGSGDYDRSLFCRLVEKASKILVDFSSARSMSTQSALVEFHHNYIIYGEDVSRQFIDKAVSQTKETDEHDHDLMREKYILLLICLRYSPKHDAAVARALEMREKIHSQKNVPSYIHSLEDEFFFRSYEKILQKAAPGKFDLRSIVTERINELMNVYSGIPSFSNHERRLVAGLIKMYPKLATALKDALEERIIEDANKCY